MELLFSINASECRWDYFKGSGKGGQKKNKTSSAVRCTHKLSGAVGTASDGRSQLHNKQSAFRRMAETKEFQKWIRIEASKKMGLERTIEEKVKRALVPENLRIEIHDDSGKWKAITENELNSLEE